MGDQTISQEEGTAVAPLETVQDLSLTDVRNWMLAIDRREILAELLVSPDPAESFSDYTAEIISGLRLWFEARAVVIVVQTAYDAYDEDSPWRNELNRLLSPLLADTKTELLPLEANEEHGHGMLAQARLRLPTRGKTVGQAVAIGQRVQALLRAARGGALTLESVRDLVRSDQVEALVGQSERSWLEAKRVPYRLNNDEQKGELAKDVAAFANSAEGGLLLVGAGTKVVDGSDTIDVIRPFPRAMADARRYRAVIASRVFPRPEALEVQVMARPGARSVAYLFVPAQRESMKPFLVRGASDGDGGLARYMQVPVRLGEDTVFEDPLLLQSQMAAGRAAQRQESAVEELRRDVQQAAASIGTPPAATAKPVLIDGQGNNSGPFHMKLDGYFFAWIANAGEAAARMTAATVDFTGAIASGEFVDGDRLDPGQQVPILFVDLRDQLPVKQLETRNAALSVTYEPLAGGPELTLTLQLQPSEQQRRWRAVAPGHRA